MSAVTLNPPPTLAAMGQLIRRLRVRCAYTLDDLARITGISKPYLSLIENGRTLHPASNGKLAAIERAIGLPTGALTETADVIRRPYLRGLLKTVAACRREACHAR